MTTCVAIDSRNVVRNSILMENLQSFIVFVVTEERLWMIIALIELVSCEFSVASDTVELDDAGKKLPEEVSPWDFTRAHTQDEFV